MAPKVKDFSAINSDEAVSKIMKAALPSTRKTVQAGFSYNESDADGSKTGFPYMQKKNVKVLMNDFSFAMLIVANIQYALRKARKLGDQKMMDRIQKCIRNMLQQGGTIRCLISANKKRGVLHRKYVVNAQQLSASIDNENGFKGILDIVYDGYTEPDSKKGVDVDKIKDGLIGKYKTKAKRMTNWIMNGPDTLRAILDILKQTGTIDATQEKTAEGVLEAIEKQSIVDGDGNKNVPPVAGGDGGTHDPQQPGPQPGPQPPQSGPQPGPQPPQPGPAGGVEKKGTGSSGNKVFVYWPEGMDENLLETYKALFMSQKKEDQGLVCIGQPLKGVDTKCYVPLLGRRQEKRLGRPVESRFSYTSEWFDTKAKEIIDDSTKRSNTLKLFRQLDEKKSTFGIKEVTFESSLQSLTRETSLEDSDGYGFYNAVASSIVALEHWDTTNKKVDQVLTERKKKGEDDPAPAGPAAVNQTTNKVWFPKSLIGSAEENDLKENYKWFLFANGGVPANDTLGLEGTLVEYNGAKCYVPDPTYLHEMINAGRTKTPGILKRLKSVIHELAKEGSEWEKIELDSSYHFIPGAQTMSKSDWCKRMRTEESKLLFVGDGGSATAPGPAAGGGEGAAKGQIPIWWPENLDQNTYLSKYTELFESEYEYTKEDTGEIIRASSVSGQVVSGKFNGKYTTAYTPFLSRKYGDEVGTKSRFDKDCPWTDKVAEGIKADATKKSDIIEILKAFNTSKKLIVIYTDIREFKENSKARSTNIDGFKKSVQFSITALEELQTGAPAPGPAAGGGGVPAPGPATGGGGVKPDPKARCQADHPTKGKPKVVKKRDGITNPYPNDPINGKMQEVCTDSGARFFMTDKDGNATRYVTDADSNVDERCKIADKNNARILDYISKNGSDEQKKLPCTVVHEKLADTKPRESDKPPVYFCGYDTINTAKLLRLRINKQLGITNAKLLILNAASEITPGGAPVRKPSQDRIFDMPDGHKLPGNADEEGKCKSSALYPWLTGGDNDSYYIEKGDKQNPFDYNPDKFSIAHGVPVYSKTGDFQEMTSEAELPPDAKIEDLEQFDFLNSAARNLSYKAGKERGTQKPAKRIWDQYAKEFGDLKVGDPRHTAICDEIEMREVQEMADQTIKAAVSNGYNGLVLLNRGGGVFKQKTENWAKAWASAINNYGKDLYVAFAILAAQIVGDKHAGPYITELKAAGINNIKYITTFGGDEAKDVQA